MVGKKIRAFREFRGYSQIQLAELSGINVGTIRKYELGIRNPKPDQLEKIATAIYPYFASSLLSCFKMEYALQRYTPNSSMTSSTVII